MERSRSQAQRSQATRDQLARTALSLFALKGYAATSMDDVCLAAGCSKGGLYYHFPSKPALLGAIVDRLVAANALVPPLDEESGELPVSAPALGRILIEIWAEAARDEGLRSQLQAAYGRVLDEAAGDHRLALVLRVGALIELLARGEETDEETLRRRLGIRDAA